MMQLTLGDRFERMVSAVMLLHKNNALHKQGFRIGDRNPYQIMAHCISECTEAMLLDGTDLERMEEELGDVLGCFLHFALTQGCDIQRIILRWLEAIPKNFPDSNVMLKPKGEG